MNILFLIDVVPPVISGMTVRIVYIFEELAKHHSIHFLYVGNEQMEPCHYEMLNKFCVSVNTVKLSRKQNLLGKIANVISLKPGMYAPYRFAEDYGNVRSTIERYIAQYKIDAIHVYGCFTAQYIKGINSVLRIWDVADSYSLDIKRKIPNASIFKKFGLWLYMKRLFNYEKEIINEFPRTILVSDIDAGMYKTVKGRRKIQVIPNGVDLEYFAPQNAIEEDYPSLIFTGHMSFPPNIDAVNYYVERIHPLIRKELPQIRFYVVGAHPTDEIKRLDRKDGIVVTGMVEDVRPYIQKSTVFVNSMISGNGIKNKVLQAMAMKKAIVSTSLGAEAIAVKDNEDIMIADQPAAFARKVLMLLQDKTMREEIGVNARKTVEQKYSWEQAINVYKEIYMKAGAERGRSLR